MPACSGWPEGRQIEALSLTQCGCCQAHERAGRDRACQHGRLPAGMSPSLAVSEGLVAAKVAPRRAKRLSAPQALGRIKPSVSKDDVRRHEEWRDTFGSV